MHVIPVHAEAGNLVAVLGFDLRRGCQDFVQVAGGVSEPVASFSIEGR